MRKAPMICMAYCMKAIISPTCMVESAIWCAPTQTMSRLTQFMMNIMAGIIKTITRLTNRLVPVRSLLALSNRSSSNFCVPKARMTIMPLRFSRVNQVELIDQLLNHLELGHGDIEDHNDQTDEHNDGQGMVQLMEAALLQRHHNAADAHDRRIAEHTDTHDDGHLNLGDVVRGARDEGGGGEEVELAVAEAFPPY